MAAYNLLQGARSSTLLNAGTLAAGTYVGGSSFDLGASVPLFVTFEIEANANGTPSGNKQLMLFLQWSLDNTNFQTGPTSGTTTTEEPDLDFVGALPMNDTNDHRKFFVVYPKARYCKPVLKNDLGVALASGNVYRADLAGVSA